MAPKDKSTAGGKPEIDKELIRELAKLLDETGLTEIEIERAGLRVRVGGRVHGDGRDAELLAGAEHPERDLAAVGDEDFVEHCAGLPPSLTR